MSADIKPGQVWAWQDTYDAPGPHGSLFEILDAANHAPSVHYWMWLLHADNGARLSHGATRRRRDCITHALLVLGLSLPTRPLGCKSQSVANHPMRRSGTAHVHVVYGAGGQVRYAQWAFANGEFIELTQVDP